MSPRGRSGFYRWSKRTLFSKCIGRASRLTPKRSCLSIARAGTKSSKSTFYPWGSSSAWQSTAVAQQMSRVQIPSPPRRRYSSNGRAARFKRKTWVRTPQSARGPKRDLYGRTEGLAHRASPSVKDFQERTSGVFLFARIQ